MVTIFPVLSLPGWVLSEVASCIPMTPNDRPATCAGVPPTRPPMTRAAIARSLAQERFVCQTR